MASATDDDATGAIPMAELRLAEFLNGEPPLPRALLLVVSGEARGEVVVVPSGESFVGRSDDADLVISDPSVSRRHARITAGPHGLELEDVGSSNGTSMNGNKIDGCFNLRDGDLVGFGSISVLVKRIT